jgi:hypothetical protein
MKNWDDVSAEMQSKGTPLSAIGYCKIAFDAGQSSVYSAIRKILKDADYRDCFITDDEIAATIIDTVQLAQHAGNVAMATGKLLSAARNTLMENLHLTDGDDCTLLELRDAVAAIDPEWEE